MHSSEPRIPDKLFYLAFRAVWLETFEIMRREDAHVDSEHAPRPAPESPEKRTPLSGRSTDSRSDQPRDQKSTSEAASVKAAAVGFLDYLPLLEGTAIHVQLDQLMRTWNRIKREDSATISVVDQCVCYCAASRLAWLGENQHRSRITDASAGPSPIRELDHLWISSKVRSQLLTFPVRFPGLHSLSNDEMLSPVLDDPAIDDKPIPERNDLLDLVGQWRISTNILANSVGLLDFAEREALAGWLWKHPQLLQR